MSYDPDHRVSCCREGCYATINLSPRHYEQLKRTGESFYCPAGHQQHFTGKTEDQKRIDALEREANGLNRRAINSEEQRDLVVSLLRRCPVCAATPGRHVRIYRDRWRFGDDLANVRDWMAEHLREAHGATVADAAREASP